MDSGPSCREIGYAMIEVPTVEEIHQIAFLTVRGWKYNSHNRTWSKEGVVIERESDYRDEGIQQKTEFDLYDARLNECNEFADPLKSPDEERSDSWTLQGAYCIELTDNGEIK